MKRIFGIFESAKWNLGERPRRQRERLQFETRAEAIGRDLRKRMNEQTRRVTAKEYEKVVQDEAQMLSTWDPIGIRDQLLTDFQPQRIDQYFENPTRNSICDNYDISQRIWTLREMSGDTRRAGWQEARQILENEIFNGRVQPPNAPNVGQPINTSSWNPANHA